MTAQLKTMMMFDFDQGMIESMSPSMKSTRKKGNYVDELAYISPIVTP